MLLSRVDMWPYSLATMVLAAGVAPGQAASAGSEDVYPNKPIRMVTGSYGSGVDVAVRLVAPGIAGLLGQPVIVDNRGSGIVRAETVAKALPDGYTLLFTGSTMWIGSLLEKTSYDPVQDFSPITLVTSTPNILVVHPALPVKSVKELIALAKAKPGELNYASAGTGGPPHLAAELFKSMAGGLDIVRINYNGAGAAVIGLIGGQIQLMMSTAPAVMPNIKSGKLRALAVTSAQPSLLAPGLPTMAASGLPGYEDVTLMAMFAPAKTPGAIINRLNQEVVGYLRTAYAKERLLNSGVEAVGSSAQEFAVRLKSEMDKWGKLIKDAGIRAD